MFKKILVPLDGSELAEVALPYAEELAGRLRADVVLAHVYESEDEEYHRMHELYINKVAENVRRGVNKYGKNGDDRHIEVETAFLVGHPAEQIVDYSDENDVDLIVIATHGRSGIRRWFLGSIAAKVVRAAKQPVALIRAEGAVQKGKKPLIDNVLLPLDGSKESETAIPYIEELAAKLKAKVTLVHVTARTYFVYSIPGETIQMPFTPEDMDRFKEKAQHYLETVASAFDKKGVEARAEVAVGSAPDEIIRMAEEMSNGIVAMATHGRSGISRWAFGSTADKVLHAGNTPVLLVRVRE